MNFLLHRHLAIRDLEAAASGLGAMLPDLWRMADRRVRPGRDRPGRDRPGRDRPGRDRQPAGSQTSPEAREALIDGVRHHLAVDRWFHRSPLFEQGESAAREGFRAARFTAPKMFFLAHVAWELALDGALVRQVGTEEIIGGLRSDLAALPGGLLHEVAVAAASPLDEASRRLFEQRMVDLWHELVESEWIPGYAHARGLAARVLGVRRRLGLEPPEPIQIERLEACCDQLLDRAGATLPRLLSAPALAKS